MIKVDILNKNKYTIIKGDKTYEFEIYGDLDVFEFIKEVKSSLISLDIDIRKNVDLNKITRDIRELYKEDLIELLLKGELY